MNLSEVGEQYNLDFETPASSNLSLTPDSIKELYPFLGRIESQGALAFIIENHHILKWAQEYKIDVSAVFKEVFAQEFNTDIPRKEWADDYTVVGIALAQLQSQLGHLKVH